MATSYMPLPESVYRNSEQAGWALREFFDLREIDALERAEVATRNLEANEKSINYLRQEMKKALEDSNKRFQNNYDMYTKNKKILKETHSHLQIYMHNYNKLRKDYMALKEKYEDTKEKLERKEGVLRTATENKRNYLFESEVKGQAILGAIDKADSYRTQNGLNESFMEEVGLGESMKEIAEIDGSRIEMDPETDELYIKENE